MLRVAQVSFFSRFSRSFFPLAVALCVSGLAPLQSFAGDYLYIGGSPQTTIVEHSNYFFRPWAALPAASRPNLKWSINNKPYWATFNTSNGELYGEVYAQQVGTYKNITISASDGLSHAYMPSFSITVTATGSGSTPPPPANPTISGTPATTATVGAAYSFTPTAKGPTGYQLTFSVKNPPSWAHFNTATGQLSGTPTAAAIGTTANIEISVSDTTATASLPAFSITVAQTAPASSASATLSWTPPTTNVDGTPLTNLAGYVVNWGTSAAALTHSAQINSPAANSYTVTNLSPGTWYFAVDSYNNVGKQSPSSSVVSANIN